MSNLDHRLYFREWARNYRLLHPGQSAAYQRQRRASKPDHIREINRKWHKGLRNEILTAYGAFCACCGETRHPFLSIDHIGGGGQAHRKRLGSSTKMYREIITQGFPKDKYRILCMNCNFGVRNGATCPHQAEKVLVGALN